MRVLIMGDMEGVSGIVHWDQVSHGSPMYQEGRRLYTAELNAAVRGARAGGATEVVVVDSHGAGAAGNMGGPAFNSLIPEEMDENCEFVTHHGWANYLDMLQEGCDACFFVGIHAMGLTPRGVLSHTVASGRWLVMRINGQPVGEIGIVAALCGHYGVPMALVTGDDQACREAVELLGEGVGTVAVKKGLGRYSARHISPKRARRMIEEGARTALENLAGAPTFKPGAPVTVSFELVSADVMDGYRRREGIKLEEPNKVHSTGETFLEAWERLAPF
ncbi:MAG: M55 family metallopeptidase [Candidatus Sumerlaeia bacterium]|nr:M55 family metallopeptidase [Candidatus Sumerlaeia bacterium]